jgi:transposase
MPLTTKQRVFILENYFKSCHTNNPNKECRKLFMREFGKKEVPSKRTVQTIISKFRQTGSVCDKKRVRKSSVLTAEKMKQIEQSFVQTPRKSLTRRSSQLGISYGSCQKAAKKLKMFPYKVKVVQELKESDPAKRLEFCQWFLEFIQEIGILDRTYFTDEAWFHLSGYINSQNTRIWGTENPNEFRSATI